MSRREDLKLSKGISRIENISSIIVSLFIFYVGWEIFQEVLRGSQNELSELPIATVGALLTIAISYFMARYKLYVGRETNSPSLIVDGYHSKMDMYSSIIVVIGLIGYLIGLVNLDKVAAVIIVILIGWTGLEIFTGAVKALRIGGLPDLEHGNEFPKRMGKHFKLVKKFGIPILVLSYFASGFYYVRWDQIGIEQRFGKPIESERPPGLHYRFPWPIESVKLVNVGNIKTVTSDPVPMLTGDENLIDVSVVTHFLVNNAFDFSFRIKTPEDMVRFAIDSSVRQMISQEKVDYILTTGKSRIQELTLQKAQMVLDNAQSGIRLVNVQLKKAYPPDEVVSAFRDVASAREDKVAFINEGFAYQNEVVPAARGQAAEIIAQADAYQQEKINRSRGEASRFLNRQQEYQKSKDITETRMYIETMEKILPGVEKMIVDSKANIDTTDIWLLKGKIGSKIFKEK
jgi:membrane protease subunit HflK